jgi:hypothetical protein
MMENMGDWLDRDDLTAAEIREHMREEGWQQVEPLSAIPRQRQETALWSLEVTHGAVPRDLRRLTLASDNGLVPVGQ